MSKGWEKGDQNLWYTTPFFIRNCFKNTKKKKKIFLCLSICLYVPQSFTLPCNFWSIQCPKLILGMHNPRVKRFRMTSWVDKVLGPWTLSYILRGHQFGTGNVTQSMYCFIFLLFQMLTVLMRTLWTQLMATRRLKWAAAAIPHVSLTPLGQKMG